MTNPTPASSVTSLPALPSVIKDPHFWATIVASFISLLVGIGVLGPDFAKSHEDLVNALAVFASVLGPAIYALARSIAQHGHQQAAATVIAAKVAADGAYDRSALAYPQPVRVSAPPTSV